MDKIPSRKTNYSQTSGNFGIGTLRIISLTIEMPPFMSAPALPIRKGEGFATAHHFSLLEVTLGEEWNNLLTPKREISARKVCHIWHGSDVLRRRFENHIQILIIVFCMCLYGVGVEY